MSRLGVALNRPLQIDLPIAVARLRTPARVVSTLLLVALMTIGVILAVGAAIAADTERWEGLGTLGTEVGAVLWFAGAVTWGARRGPTVGRAVMLATMFAAGLMLIGVALIGEWSGATLALAMEFGVGLLAVPLIDVVLIGTLHDRLQRFASGADD